MSRLHFAACSFFLLKITSSKGGDLLARDLTTGSIGKNILVFSIPYLISYFLQTLPGTGRSLHHRPVPGSGEHHGRLHRQPGHAHGDGHHRRPRDGHDDHDCALGRCARQGGGLALHRQHGHAVPRRLRRARSRHGRAAAASRRHHVHAGGSCRWHARLPLLLRAWHPADCGLQHHCGHLPRTR